MSPQTKGEQIMKASCSLMIERDNHVFEARDIRTKWGNNVYIQWRGGTDEVVFIQRCEVVHTAKNDTNSLAGFEQAVYNATGYKLEAPKLIYYFKGYAS